jgi:hypothetical protein
VAANAEGAAPKRARRLHRILVRDGSGADPDGDSKKIERRVPQEEDVSHPEHEIETAIFAPDGIPAKGDAIEKMSACWPDYSFGGRRRAMPKTPLTLKSH